MSLDDSLNEIANQISPSSGVVRVSLIDARTSHLRGLVREQLEDIARLNESFKGIPPQFQDRRIQKPTPKDKYLALVERIIEPITNEYYYFVSLREEECSKVVVPGENCDAEFYFRDGMNAHFFVAHVLSSIPRKEIYEISAVSYTP